MMIAVEKNRVGVVQCLLEHGADVNAAREVWGNAVVVYRPDALAPAGISVPYD